MRMKRDMINYFFGMSAGMCFGTTVVLLINDLLWGTLSSLFIGIVIALIAFVSSLDSE